MYNQATEVQVLKSLIALRTLALGDHKTKQIDKRTNKQKTKNKYLKQMNKAKSGDRTDSINSQLYFAIIFWYSQLQIVFLTSNIWTKESAASITRHTFCRHPFWKKYIYLTSSFVLLFSSVMISSYFHKMSELSFTLVNFIIVLLSLLSRK